MFAQPVKIPLVGAIYASSTSNASRLGTLAKAMKELGYVEGKTILFEALYAEGDLARYPVIAAEMVRRNPAVIVSGGPGATRPLKLATSTIPIIMMGDNDPVASGTIASFARPGGNITGLSNTGAAISGKRIELLKDAIPRLSRVAVFVTPNDAALPGALAEVRNMATKLGITIQLVEVGAPNDLASAFRTASAGRVEAVLILPSAVLAGPRKEIAALAIEHKLPTMVPNDLYVVDGGLMSYTANLAELDWRAGVYVDKILRGAKPAELPVEQPTKFDLVINLRTARAIGLRIAPSLVLRADRVID